MQKLLERVHKNPPITLALKLISHAVSLLSVLAFGYIIYVAAIISWDRVAGVIVTLGVPYLLVTLLRRAINAPRPYELLEFSKEPPKKRQGSSFPSRHAHSAFAIGTLLCFFSLPLGIALLALSALMCVCRVLLGIHFVRDVLAGALTGITTALIGAMFL